MIGMLDIGMVIEVLCIKCHQLIPCIRRERDYAVYMCSTCVRVPHVKYFEEAQVKEA